MVTIIFKLNDLLKHKIIAETHPPYSLKQLY